MFDKKPYAILKNAIEPEVVASLRVIAERLPSKDGTVGPGDGKCVDQIRRAQVAFFPEAHWVGALMFHFGAICNAYRWRHSVRWPTPVQYSCYGPGGYYNWHSDEEPIFEAESYIRKISIVIVLSGPGEYLGGNLQFRSPNTKNIIDVPEACVPGNVIVFPSILEHQVTPVIQGERRSLVCWLLAEVVR